MYVFKISIQFGMNISSLPATYLLEKESISYPTSDSFDGLLNYIITSEPDLLRLTSDKVNCSFTGERNYISSHQQTSTLL